MMQFWARYAQCRRFGMSHESSVITVWEDFQIVLSEMRYRFGAQICKRRGHGKITNKMYDAWCTRCGEDVR